MRYKKFIFIFLLFSLALLPLLAPLTAFAQAAVDPKFNPNNILADGDLLDYSSLGLADIQNFLQAKGSYLANYYAPDTYGTVRTAAEIIYNAASNNYDCDGVILNDSHSETERIVKCRHITTVSPKFLLILLQKEQGLVEDPSPSQNSLDWATGYGCPDNWVCNPYYKGFGKQVNSAALQFLAYVNEQDHYTYKMGQTYTISNTPAPYCTETNQTMVVTPANKATAALYNYTPHVFNGNYNVYKIWQRYWPTNQIVYPDGSVLQVKGNPAIWLIQNGHKRLFANYAAFVSRYKPEQVVTVKQSDLDNYPAGNPIKLANYSLVQTPDKTIYLLVDSEKRPFASLAVFKKIGFNPDEIDKAAVADLAGYTLGKAITATSTYVTGTLMQDIKTGGVYYVENGTKAPILDKIFLTTKYKDKKIIKVSATTLSKYTTVSPILFPDGTLMKTASSPSVYLISNGQKRPFADGATFDKLGYSVKNILTVSSQLLYNYPLGAAIQTIQ